jgi:hypothetical protein
MYYLLFYAFFVAIAFLRSPRAVYRIVFAAGIRYTKIYTLGVVPCNMLSTPHERHMFAGCLASFKILARNVYYTLLFRTV